MHVFVVGLNHKTAPLWLRERAAFPADAGAARMVRERAELAEAFVLSTCNRVEVYGASRSVEVGAAADRLLALMASRAGVTPAQLREHAYVHRKDDAVRHLCRVASGFDSMVLGETQIVAQLKRAIADARKDGAIGRVLQRLSCTALAASKRIRTGAGTGPTSMADAAVRALGGQSTLDGAAVAIVGAGETAADVLRCLRGARTRRIVIVNRSPERAAALAGRHADVLVAPWSELAEVVAAADVVFGVTSAREPVIGPAHFHGVEARTRQLVDLGVPRNVDPAARSVPGVRLLDVDALRAWSAGRLPEREDGTAPVHADETALEYWVARFGRWLAGQVAVPTITQLRDGAERVRQLELERAMARLGDLDEREREIVQALTHRLVAKLLHHPLAALAAEPDPATLVDPARRLFGLALGEVPPPSCPAAPERAAAVALPPAALTICPVTGIVAEAGQERPSAVAVH